MRHVAPVKCLHMLLLHPELSTFKLHCKYMQARPRKKASSINVSIALKSFQNGCENLYERLPNCQQDVFPGTTWDGHVQ